MGSQRCAIIEITNLVTHRYLMPTDNNIIVSFWHLLW